MTTAKHLLAHSWRMIVKDVPTTLRLVLVPWAVMTACQLGVEYASVGYFSGAPNLDEELAWLPMVISPLWYMSAFVVVVICYMWIAVSWHRYVLKGEQPGPLLPKWQGGRLLDYFGKAILVWLPILPVLIAMLIFALVVFDADRIGATKSPGQLSFVLVFSVAISYLSLRLGLVLPAAAIGEKMKLGDAWRLTKPWGDVALTCAAVFAVLYVAIGILMEYFQHNNLLYLVFCILSDVVALLALSLLTTLYGVLVQGRSLLDKVQEA